MESPWKTQREFAVGGRSTWLHLSNVSFSFILSGGWLGFQVGWDLWGFKVFIIEQPHLLTECNFLNRLKSNNLGKRKGGEIPPPFLSYPALKYHYDFLTLCSELGISEPRLPHSWKVLVLGTMRVGLKRSSDPFSWVTCWHLRLLFLQEWCI